MQRFFLLVLALYFCYLVKQIIPSSIWSFIHFLVAMTLSATYDHLIFDKFTSLRSVTPWITFFYLPFSNWFAFCLSYSMYCFFLFSFFSLWKDFLFVWFTLLFSLLILSHCHYFVSFRFHSMIYLISWLHRAASFWLIHFQFIFNLSFSFLSMTQLLFPIVYVFIVFKGIFCLFSINYWKGSEYT